MTEKVILFVDIAGFKPLPRANVLLVTGNQASITSVTDKSAALSILDYKKNFDIIVSNCPDLEMFQKIRDNQKSAHSILLTESTMEVYSKALKNQEHNLIDYVIANRYPNSWTINELRVTLQKIIKNEIFGIEKYLDSGTLIETCPVTGSNDREILNTRVMDFADKNKLGSYLSKLIFGISEELLMNAIYDAPIAAGRVHYGEAPRTSPIQLKPEEYATLNYGFDGHVFAIGVRDPFGAFKKGKLFQYLKKVVNRRDSDRLIDTKKGGAGLGLFKILYSCHALVCNVEPNQSTEVIAIIDTQEQVRDFSKMARSVHYFKKAS